MVGLYILAGRHREGQDFVMRNGGTGAPRDRPHGFKVMFMIIIDTGILSKVHITLTQRIWGEPMGEAQL